jgi:hypothetical protein
MDVLPVIIFLELITSQNISTETAVTSEAFRKQLNQINPVGKVKWQRLTSFKHESIQVTTAVITALTKFLRHDTCYTVTTERNELH